MTIHFEARCDECYESEYCRDFDKIQAFHTEHKDCLLRDQPEAPSVNSGDGIKTEDIGSFTRELSDRVFVPMASVMIDLYDRQLRDRVFDSSAGIQALLDYPD